MRFLRPIAISVLLVLPCLVVAEDGQRGPEIQVVSPPDGAVLRSPIAVEIRFTPTADSHIDRESLRVTVEKLWTMDITDRVRPYLKGNEISIVAADIPKGQHTINISIADEDGRSSSRTLNVAVR
jgi:hypothetical protein